MESCRILWGLLTPEHLAILQHTNCFYSLRNEKFTDERNMPASSGFSSIVTALRTHFGGGDSARQVGSNLTAPYAQRTETMRAFLERIKKEFSKDLNTEWDTWPRQQRRNQVRRFLMGLVKEDYDHSSTPKDEWSQHVDGRLARHHGWVGGLHGHRVVGTAGALIPVSPPPARVWGGLVGGLLGHLRVRGHWGHWAVAFEMSGGSPMMAGRGLRQGSGCAVPVGIWSQQLVHLFSRIRQQLSAGRYGASAPPCWGGGYGPSRWYRASIWLMLMGSTADRTVGMDTVPYPHDAGC